MSEPEIIEAEIVEQMERLPAVREATALVARGEISVDEVAAQHDKIVQVMRAVMKPGVHYGVIPGVGKPSLFKAGAETINVALRLAPHYVSDKIWHDDGHLTVSVVCTLRHIPTGLEVATGEGLCTSRESRYAYRQGSRECPECGQAAIIKGKAEYGGGWVCFKKKGGCGAKWDDDSDQGRAFQSADIGRVDNPDLPDTFNTVLKMADKRALIAAVLNGTAASDVFTQDVEDTPAGDRPLEQEAYRVEGPPALKPPTSWAKITEMVGVYDEQVNEWYSAFADSARRLLFPESQPSMKGSPKAERDHWFRVCAGAAVHLREAADPTVFPPPTLEDIRACFARVLDGQELAIPDEQLDDEAAAAAERDG